MPGASVSTSSMPTITSAPARVTSTRCDGSVTSTTKAEGHDDAPHHRRRPQERQHGEGADADQRADQVPAVGGQRRAARRSSGRPPRPARPARPRPGRRSPAAPARPAGRWAQRGEVDEVGRRPGRCVTGNRRTPTPAAASSGTGAGRDHRPASPAIRKPSADAEERAEQHEVREVGQVHDVRARASGSAPARGTA